MVQTWKSDIESLIKDHTFILTHFPHMTAPSDIFGWGENREDGK